MEDISALLVSKYPTEFILEFQSNDRFLYRVSDLDLTGLSEELQRRIDKCQIYVIAKRPRLSIVPGSVETTDTLVRLQVQYHLNGSAHQAGIDIPRDSFLPEEVNFESSHQRRELISRNASGAVVAETLLANYVDFMPAVHQQAKDLEVVYIGKGQHDSAQDRLRSHPTLQRILGDLNSNEQESEVFVLVYSFRYRKPAQVFVQGYSHEITGVPAKRRREKAMAYSPSLNDQISLIEASCIWYFQPAHNKHYLKFPRRGYKMLAGVYEADFAAIVVQLDNTNIGSQRLYSSVVKPDSTHYVVVNFRRLEGKPSLFDGRTEIQRQS